MRYLVLLALLLITCPAMAQTKLWILAGQSNMTGGANPFLLPPELQVPQTDIDYRYFLRSQNPVLAPQWVDLQPLGTHGPEITFGRDVADGSPTEDFGIIKYAVNGSTIRSWVPGSSQGLYEELVSTVADFRADLPGPSEIAGFFWVQGTADSGFQPWADEYLNRLQTLTNSLRAEWGEPQLPVIIGQQHVDTDRAFTQTVRQAKTDFTNVDSFATLVNIDDLPLKPDMIHYESVTQQLLGHRAARIVNGPARQLGDTNWDGFVNAQDITTFVRALGEPQDWFLLAYPDGCWECADTNADTFVNAQDVDSFVALLTDGGVGTTSIPEPGSLLILGGLTWLTLSRKR